MMANVVWFMVCLAGFMLGWSAVEKSGSKVALVVMTVCGMAAFMRVLVLGGII